jgi:uncharacterized membrane protein YeaQ/YmgE (transglycosylase-associated protein family)
MEQLLINLITGALGGAAVGKSSPTFDLGTIGNIIAGLVGGGVLGQIVTLLLPSVVAAAESSALRRSHSAQPRRAWPWPQLRQRLARGLALGG